MNELSRYERACVALAEARTTDDLKDVMNKLQAIKEYAKRAKNRLLEVDAGEIRHRAERRYGELLTEMKATGQIVEGRPKTVISEVPFSRLTLADLDTTKNFSSHCQRLAAVSARQFENLLADR